MAGSPCSAVEPRAGASPPRPLTGRCPVRPARDQLRVRQPPPANAIDGDAGTDWCTSSWTGTLTVDLGQVRELTDLGITMDATSPSASATIQVASQAGAWQAVPAAKNVALDPGNPMYIPLPRGTQARYAEITVYSDTGADVCLGEFRTFGPDPAAANMDLGTDLSFTQQELASGAQFSFRGQVQNPVSIMRENGSDYVRLRLWVDPPPGYNDLASDLAMARLIRASGMKLLLDIQYSDFWADPSKQNIPAAWQGQDLAQLTVTVRNYTQQVISAFAPAGHAGRHGGHRQRDPQRHAVADRPGRPQHRQRATTTWPSCSRPASPALRRATRLATSCSS